MVANIRSFSSMCSCVNCQGTSLDESLIAAFNSTVVRSLVSMNLEMPAEIRVAIKRLELVNMRAAKVQYMRKEGSPFHKCPMNT